MSQRVDLILDVLPEYQGDKRLVKRRQDTFDIIREVERKHRKTIGDYNAICQEHWRGDAARTARDIYDFLKSNVPYHVEPTLTQTVKTPAAILEERLTFGNDCKHYASYAVGVMQALERMGYPIRSFYRFASYNQGKRNPGHVFAVCVANGREIWIDPVPEIGGFDRRETSPIYHEDRIPPMSKSTSIGSLYDISGIGNDARVNGPHHRPMHWLDEMAQMRSRPHLRMPGHQHTHHHNQDQIFHQRGSAPERVGDMDEISGKKKHGLHIKAPHIKIKAPKIKLPHIKIEPGKLLLKVTMAPSRGSFLLLTEVNMFNLAVNLWKHAAHDTSSAGWKKLSGEWKHLGGKPAALMTAIKKGLNTHNKLHPHAQVHGLPDMYSMVSGYNAGEMAIGNPGIVAAIAAAAPVIAALKNILKGFGMDPDKMNKSSQDAQDTVAKNHNKKHGKEDATDDDGDTTHDDGTKTSAKTNEDGTQELHIKDVPGAKDADDNTGGHDDKGDYTGEKKPAKKDAGGDGDDEDDKSDLPAPKKPDSLFHRMLNDTVNFIGDHKMWFIGGGIAIAAIIILPKLFHHGPKRRR